MNRYALILIVFLFAVVNIFAEDTMKIDLAETTEQTESISEEIKIENYEDAKEAYSIALFYKEKAIASHILDEETKLNLEKARDILTEVVKFIPSKETYFELAETYEALYKIDSALQIYEELLNTNQYDDEVLFRIGERYLFFKADLDKAEYYLKTSLLIEENNNDALILLGYLFYEKGDYKNASKYFSKVDVTKGGKENYLDYYNFYYAVSEFNRGNFKKTLQLIDNVKLNKISEVEKAQAVFIKAKSYQALEQYKKAYDYVKTEEVKQLVSDFYYEAFLSALAEEYDNKLFEEMIDTYNTPKIIRIAYTANTENPKSAINMIETDIDRNNIDLDIIQYYYLLVNKYGNDEQKKQAEIDIIEFYGKNQIYEPMEKHIDNLIKKYPEISESKGIYVKLAHIYITTENNKEEARKYLKKYLSVATEDDIEINFNIIVHLILNLEDYELGINILDKISNSDTDLYYALFYSNLKNIEKTKEYLTLAYENLDYSDYYLSTFFNAVANTGDKDLITYYGEKLIDTGSFIIINNYSWALINQDIDYETGIEYMESVLEDDPTNSIYMDTLSWGYYKAGEYEKALNLLLEAGLSIPKENEAELYLHLADVYYQMGNNEKALFNYRYSKTIDYKSEDYNEEYVNSQIEKLKK